jgi:hypothetical protein
MADQLYANDRCQPLHGSIQHPLLAGTQPVADALGHAVQAAADEVAADAMLGKLRVIAAWLEDRALRQMLLSHIRFLNASMAAMTGQNGPLHISPPT